MKLNLGAGAKRFHLKGWINVDNNPACEPDVLLDVGQREWRHIYSTTGLKCDFREMFEPEKFDAIRADNLLEHLPWPDFLHCMNECWRVLKPGGIFWLRVPNADEWPNGAWGDPTHQRFFFPKSFQYFDIDCPTYRDYGKDYGFKPWKLVKVSDYSAPDPRGEVGKAFFEREYTPVK